MRDEESSSPYFLSNAHGDLSSRAITSVPTPALETSSPHISTQNTTSAQRTRSGRSTNHAGQFNLPLRAHVWRSKRNWRRLELDKERQEFFDTRVTGRPEIWATLKVVIGLLAEGEIQNAQGILDASAITVPTGDLMNGVYDETGNFYQMPEHIISDPENLVLSSQEEFTKSDNASNVTDECEIEKRRDEKGKGVLKSADILRVKARLSDRGGPDVVVTIGKEQTVKVLIRRIQEEVDVRIPSNIQPSLADAHFDHRSRGRGR